MVNAILAGTKTQTRRIVKPQPPHSCHYAINGNKEKACCLWTEAWENKQFDRCFVPPTPKSKDHLLPCPYGKPGDHLWVRETCRAKELADGQDGVLYEADGGFIGIAETQDAADAWMKLNSYHGKRGATVPPIHMPRWASRITLEITDVRVERVQSISEADATAEGFPGNIIDGKRVPWSAYGWFLATWQVINGKESWESNPWVWALTFRKVEKSS